MSATAPAALITDTELAALEAAGLGELGARLLGRIEHDRQEISWRDSRIDKLTFEMARLKRVKFGQRTEQFNAEQKALFDEAVDANIAALEDQLEALIAAARKPEKPRTTPKRTALPTSFPRVERHHEPENTTCSCGCALQRIGEDVSEKLDYTPGRLHRRAATSAASGPAAITARWCKRLCPPRSSTRASRPRGCLRRS